MLSLLSKIFHRKKIINLYKNCTGCKYLAECGDGRVFCEMKCEKICACSNNLIYEE
jgi:hypothetical protein